MAVNRESIADRLKGKIAAVGFILLGLQVMADGCSARQENPVQSPGTLPYTMAREFAGTAGEHLSALFMPILGLAQEKSGHRTFWLLQEQVESMLPFYGFAEGERGGQDSGEKLSIQEVLKEEAVEGSAALPEESPQESLSSGETDARAQEELSELLQTENEAAILQQSIEDPLREFIPHVRQAQVDLTALEDYETLVKEFYTIDGNTMAGSNQLDAAKRAAKDLSISKDDPGPQILIYHTHSQEGFSDSVEGDDSTTIQGVGEHLAQILRDTYGYQVLHHTGEYDVESRDNAYGKALPAIEQVLAENPSIKVVIDLHRDQVPESTRLSVDLDGRPTARFMFFNGLSRTKTTGDIAYLYNENQDDNLAFSFQMQKAAAEYYPGLTRKIYLKGYRYNMHLKPRSLLIELGAQNNTLEEAMNACDPLAHILDMVLSGAD